MCDSRDHRRSGLERRNGLARQPCPGMGVGAGRAARSGGFGDGSVLLAKGRSGRSSAARPPALT